MGVPGFFLWLLKNHKKDKFIYDNIENIDALMLDANCMLHPQCFKILDLYKDNLSMDFDKLEDKMISH